ncbi:MULTISPECIES: hypothetical protein [Rothia]|uniref:hypothetical protein n=1 Tax=Rothia TaxID=32207 RepID=UPI001F19B91E|nr:hypothetical protein [Rothia nasimurium]
MTLTPAQKVAKIQDKNALRDTTQDLLPGFEEPAHEVGNLEAATRRTVVYMQEIGLVTQAEEAYCVLAIEAAREWDRGARYGKLSGKAMYLNAVNSVFSELPKLEKTVEAAGMTIDNLIDAITAQPNTPTPLS